MARRVQSIGETFRVAKQNCLTQMHRALVSTAKREHGRVMATDPRPASFTRIVDGHEGAPEEAVRPAGVIVYRYPRLELVAQYAMEVLFDLSPVLSGEYRNSHMLLVDGSPVASLKGWRPGQEIVISNTVPYSRKIEIGKMRMRVPGTDMVYQQARRKVMARYGNLAKVEFTYRGIVGGVQVNQAAAGSFGQPWWLGGAAPREATGTREIAIAKARGQTAHNRPNVRFPCLIIREL
jgi:hypothetical protein